MMSNLIKYPKKNLDNFIYKNIKKNKMEIFKYNNFAYLVHVRFPRKTQTNSINYRKERFYIIKC